MFRLAPLILRNVLRNRRRSLQLILGESVVISIFGGLAGLGLGLLLSKGMESGAFPFQGLKWQAAAVVLVMAMAIGLFAALVPAIVASRKNVVESLRFTG